MGLTHGDHKMAVTKVGPDTFAIRFNGINGLVKRKGKFLVLSPELRGKIGMIALRTKIAQIEGSA